jgi:putative membrane protein
LIGGEETTTNEEPTMRRKLFTATLAGSAGAMALAGVALAQDRPYMMRDDRRPWLGLLIFLVVVALVVLVVVFALRSRPASPAAPTAPAAPSPTAAAEALLAERLARGEIGPDDYRTTLAALRGATGAPQPPQ